MFVYGGGRLIPDDQPDINYWMIRPSLKVQSEESRLQAPPADDAASDFTTEETTDIVEQSGFMMQPLQPRNT